MKKIPMRRCVATNESYPKKDLLRIVRTPEGQVEVDSSGRKNGKGAYIVKNEKALAILKKRKILQSKFQVEIDDSIYEEIGKVISGE